MPAKHNSAGQFSLVRRFRNGNRKNRGVAGNGFWMMANMAETDRKKSENAKHGDSSPDEITRYLGQVQH